MRQACVKQAKNGLYIDLITLIGVYIMIEEYFVPIVVVLFIFWCKFDRF